MRITLLIAFLCLAGCAYKGQKNNNTPQNIISKPHPIQSYTFGIEKLTPPNTLLQEMPDTTIYKKLLWQDAGFTDNSLTKPTSYNPFAEVVASYHASSALVNYGYHSFFDGLYHAYAEHRPFTLSPDMIWQLIMQGFSQHVNNNAEQLRKHFVSHQGKLTLLVRNDAIDLGNPNSPWEDVFPEFTKQIGDYIGKNELNTFTSNFSTSTTVTKMASQITLMNAMKEYFEYVVFTIGCGIPSITIEGTAEDWKLVLQKTKALEKYELGWWTKQLYPILNQFVKAAQKQEDKDFWRNMFKIHKANQAYKSDKIDGWFVKFYPYDKNGKRNSLDTLSGSANLPDEICKVDILYQTLSPTDASVTQTVPLEIWAGFIGLKQNNKSFNLKPEIGWMIKRTDSVNKEVVKQLASKDDIEIRVRTVPKEILALKKIKKLSIYFIENIVVPDEMKNIRIEKLNLNGKISDKEMQRIFNLFPNTEVIINFFSNNKQDKSSIKDLPIH